MQSLAAGLDRKFGAWLPPLFLLGLCVLAYGLWVPRMGWYWDDLPIGWIARTYGGEGLERYFSTVRPVWGLLYRLTTPILGVHPLAWQVFAIFWRWVSGVMLWWLLRLIWPRQADFAGWAAAIFVLYPGFSQQFISLVYTHFFIVLSGFLASLAFSLLALRAAEGRRCLAWGILAWALGLWNLLSLEYFFFLELLRPVFFWIALGQAEDRFWPRVKRALAAWLPYAAGLLGVIFWRTFFFQSALYQPVFTAQLKADPIGALLHLGGRIAEDAWLTGVLAWGNAFRLPLAEELTPNLMLIYWGVVAVGAGLCLGYAFLTRAAGERGHGGRWFAGALPVGVFALLIAGAPYWLTNLPLRLTFHFDRFNLSFMLGAALAGAGLLFLAPVPRWLRVLPLAAALGFSAGYQYQQAIVYIRDWNVQQRLFWQLAWRMPGVEPGTLFLSNELPVRHYSDNSLTAAFNWVFAPENTSQNLSYALFYPTVRLGADLPALEKGLPIRLDYLAATFQGNTSQAVAFYYNPPGCARVLDPFVERDNYTLPRYLREAMVLSGTGAILSEGRPELPEAIFGRQSEGSWCYYFEKADLARQLKDWQKVVELGELGFASGDYPNDPLERFPFIEAYAHTGDWARALEQSRLASRVAPVYEIVVCRLWERIAVEAPAGAGRDEAVRTIWSENRCDEPRQEPPAPEPNLEETP